MQKLNVWLSENTISNRALFLYRNLYWVQNGENDIAEWHVMMQVYIYQFRCLSTRISYRLFIKEIRTFLLPWNSFKLHTSFAFCTNWLSNSLTGSPAWKAIFYNWSCMLLFPLFLHKIAEMERSKRAQSLFSRLPYSLCGKKYVLQSLNGSQFRKQSNSLSAFWPECYGTLLTRNVSTSFHQWQVMSFCIILGYIQCRVFTSLNSLTLIFVL